MVTLLDPGTFLSQNPAASNNKEQRDHPVSIIPQAGGRNCPPREPGKVAITDFAFDDEPEDDDLDDIPYSRSAASDEEEVDGEQQERCYPPDEYPLDETDPNVFRDIERAQANFHKLMQLRAHYAQTSLSEEEIVHHINAELAADGVVIDCLPAHWKEVQ